MTAKRFQIPNTLYACLAPLIRSPRFALIVVLILGLGIGINVATLGLLYRYDVSPLPWPQGGRVVSVYFTANQPTPKAMSIPTWQRLRKSAPAMANSGLYSNRGYNLVQGDHILRLNGVVATDSVFSTLGVQPILGRTFGSKSDHPGAKPVVVLSYQLWKNLFSGRRSAIGKTLKLNGKLFTVIGVMPRDFNFPTAQTALWTPRTIVPFDDDADNLTAFSDQMIARLAPGQSIHTLKVQANFALKKEISNFPDPTAIPLFKKYDFHIDVKSWRASRIGRLHQSLTLVLFATTLLMLLVWFNLANLFLARLFSRHSELAMRRILGAKTGTLAASLALENFVLSLFGAGLGIIFGKFLLGLFSGSTLATIASSIPGTSWPVLLGIALALALVSTTIFTAVGLGLLRGRNLATAIGEDNNRASQGPVARRVRLSLLVSQIALACALAGCGLLLGRSLLNLNAVNLGFKPNHVVTFRMSFPQAQYPLAKMTASLKNLRMAIAQSAGIKAASISSNVPFDGGSGGNDVFPRPAKPAIHPAVFAVATDAAYFRSLGMPLLAGRNFRPADIKSGVSLAIISTLTAKQLFGTTNAIGREFSFDSPHINRFGILFRVIGIVPTVQRANPGMPPAMGSVYIDYAQVIGKYPNWSWEFRDWYLVVRSSLPRAAIISQVKNTAHQLIPGVPLYHIMTMNQRVATALASNRLLAALVSLFAFGALLLAAIGLYAVQAYTVAQRAREFAIRLALGAERSHLLAMVIGEAARLLVIGLLIGLAGLAAIGVVFASSFYGISAFDPVSMLMVAAALCATTVAGGWLPAWRASRTVAAHALRN